VWTTTTTTTTSDEEPRSGKSIVKAGRETKRIVLKRRSLLQVML